MPLARCFPLFCMFKSLFIIEGMTKMVCWFAFVVKLTFLGIRTELSWVMTSRECLRLFLKAYFGPSTWLAAAYCAESAPEKAMFCLRAT